MSSAVVGAGSVLSGRYRLVEPLASGGMGTVWRALDLLLDRPVAVKEVRLPPGLDEAERELLRRRTIREAQVAARLRHAAIVTIFDVVEQDGRPWIVMELVPSRSLAQIIRSRGPLPPIRVAGIGLRVLDAIVAAAAAGVEHRDIKPANVLVTDEGRVVLTDFGIARHVGDETLTAAGLLIGSPDYLAPERARGRPGGLAADLWSLGATMYDAVEGRRPFERNGPLPTLAAVVMDEPEPPQRAGPLRPVIDGLLVKNPAYRLDADRTRAMLERVVRGRPAGGTLPLPQHYPADAPGPAATLETPTAVEHAPAPRAATDRPDRTGPAGAAGTADGAGAAAAAGAAGRRRRGRRRRGGQRAGAGAGGAGARAAGAPGAGAAGGRRRRGRRRRRQGRRSRGRRSRRSWSSRGSRGRRSRRSSGGREVGPRGRSDGRRRKNGRQASGARRSSRHGSGRRGSGRCPAAQEQAARGRPARRRRDPHPAGHPLAPEADAAGPCSPASSCSPSPASPRSSCRRSARAATTRPAAPPPQRRRPPSSPGPIRAGQAGHPRRRQAARTSTQATSRPPTTSRRPASPTPPAAGAQLVAPAGFTRYTDPRDGFSLIIPSGWRPVRRDTRVDFDDPGSSRFLRIDTSDTPLPDPYQNWVDYERQFRQGKSGYRLIGIRRVPDYRPSEGWSTADWEFVLGGTHVLDRNIRVSSARAHAIYWSTPDSQWNAAANRQILDLAERSFVPAPTGG